MRDLGEVAEEGWEDEGGVSRRARGTSTSTSADSRSIWDAQGQDGTRITRYLVLTCALRSCVSASDRTENKGTPLQIGTSSQRDVVELSREH